MTMRRFSPRTAPVAVDPVPAAIMKAMQMNRDDPNHAHFCVIQRGCNVQVLRHVDDNWRTLFSTRRQEEKKVSLRKKYQ